MRPFYHDRYLFYFRGQCPVNPDIYSRENLFLNLRQASQLGLVAVGQTLVLLAAGLDLSLVLVSNEVGMSLVPDNRLGRLYRDLLGRANQSMAAVAQTVYLMVAGIPLTVKQPDRR